LSGITKKDSGEPLNPSFLSYPNQRYFKIAVMDYWINNLLDERPIVLLPCGMGAKTRNKCYVLELSSLDEPHKIRYIPVYPKKNKTKKNGIPEPIFTDDMILDPRKFFKHMTTHQIMSCLTRWPKVQRLVVSEPQVAIPDAIEAHPIREDYNVPPESLERQHEWIFVDRLCALFLKIKLYQPWRDYIFYVGGQPHFFIVEEALWEAGFPFKLIYNVGDMNKYSKLANKMRGTIESHLILGDDWIPPKLERVDPEEYLKKKKGNKAYNHQGFIKELVVVRRERKKWIKSRIEITTQEDLRRGWGALYPRFRMKAIA